MASASRSPRPPFRYQHTEAYPQEKYSDVELVDTVDEKAAPKTFASGSSSHPAESREQVRAASRDVAHTQSATSHRSLEPRSHPLSSPHAHPGHARTHPHRFHSHPPPVTFAAHRQGSPIEMTTCCGIAMSPCAKAWLPLGAWIVTTLAFVIAIGWWREEVFLGLETLSEWIKTEGNEGQAILFFLIFVTTFPPMPLYSTLITLSGYSLGAVQGAILSYFAALTGAIAVFLLSRTYLRASINEMIANAPCSVRRALRAVEKQPKLLFLIRLSPYPYNLMNALLATSRISFATYTTCTALSLFKVIIHTSIGAGIHSFSSYHTHPTDGDSTESGNDEGDSDVSRILTIAGIVLCISLLVYLSWVARRAVDDIDEDDDELLPTVHRARLSRGRHNSGSDADDERAAFLTPMVEDDSWRPSVDVTRLATIESRQMTESPLQILTALPMRSPRSQQRGLDSD